MDTSNRGSRRARLIATGALVAGVLLAGAASASAQIGEHLLPPIEDPLDTSSLLPTPLPTSSLKNLIDDTVDETTGLLDDDLKDQVDETTKPIQDPLDDAGGGISDTLEGLVGGEEESGPGGSTPPGDQGTNDPGNGGDGGDGGDGDAGTPGTDGSPGSSGSEGSSGTGGLLGDARGDGSPGAGGAGGTMGAGTPYGSVTARAVVAAATRAAHLALPLAPPLILAGAALLGIASMGRGSDRLLKVDALRRPARRFRL